jgi:hypothetical protein
VSKPPVDQLAPSNQSHHSQEFNLAPRMDAATMDGTGGRGAANSAQGKAMDGTDRKRERCAAQAKTGYAMQTMHGRA